jgi:hypothetical protein
MVRIKHRYLLVNILYPNPETANVQPAKSGGNTIPYAVRFRQPSSDRVDHGILLKAIRNGVETVFGDYGSGKIASSLQSKCSRISSYTHLLTTFQSQILVTSNKHRYCSHLKGPLPPGMGRVELCYQPSETRQSAVRLPGRACLRHHP